MSVVSERGVVGLTHRAVAAVADVPLGSTTYYFDSLDDLLAAAMELAAARNANDLRDWAAGFGPDTDLAAVMTDLVMRRAGPDRDRMVIGYELYLAALRRPALRPISAAWSHVLIELLERYTDRATASGMSAVFDGFMIRSLLDGTSPDRTEVALAFERLLRAPAGRAR